MALCAYVFIRLLTSHPSMGLLHERNDLSQQLRELFVAFAAMAEHALGILELFVLW